MEQTSGVGESRRPSDLADRFRGRELVLVSILFSIFALVGAVVPLSEKYGAKCSESGAIVFRLTGSDVEVSPYEPTESAEHRRGRCVTEANLRIATLGLNLLFVLAARHRIFRAPSELPAAALALIGFGDLGLIVGGITGQLQGFEPQPNAPCGGDDAICSSSFGLWPFALGLIGIGVAVILADFRRRRVQTWQQ